MGNVTPAPREPKHSFWTSVPGILTGIAAVITAVGAIIGIYVGTKSTPPAQPPTTAAPTSAPYGGAYADPAATIYLQYRGDSNQCALQLTTKIAGKTVSIPNAASTISVSGVPQGAQKYEVAGQIACPTLGTFDAYGSGTINVTSGNTYYYWWSQSPGTKNATVTIGTQ
ncbi:hypothetical protein ABZW96_10675 [Nocardia sp. NPDC004168]|uniref:hypothetical protein n=1 Tax=Nocardia sp. NPDC004168 TaxID=3154452 RepID=UPI0033BF79CC